MKTKFKPEFQAGEFASNDCKRCRKPVKTRFEYRTVQLSGTRLRVPDVLVDVCLECDHMVSMPRQSIAQLREVGTGK